MHLISIYLPFIIINHKYGQSGSGKHITSKLELIWKEGNVSKTDRMSAKDMAEGEIQEEKS